MDFGQVFYSQSLDISQVSPCRLPFLNDIYQTLHTMHPEYLLPIGLIVLHDSLV